jgi:hypothetical protein
LPIAPSPITIDLVVFVVCRHCLRHRRRIPSPIVPLPFLSLSLSLPVAIVVVAVSCRAAAHRGVAVAIVIVAVVIARRENWWLQNGGGCSEVFGFICLFVRLSNTQITF